MSAGGQEEERGYPPQEAGGVERKAQQTEQQQVQQYCPTLWQGRRGQEGSQSRPQEEEREGEEQKPKPEEETQRFPLAQKAQEVIGKGEGEGEGAEVGGKEEEVAEEKSLERFERCGVIEFVGQLMLLPHQCDTASALLHNLALQTQQQILVDLDHLVLLLQVLVDGLDLLLQGFDFALVVAHPVVRLEHAGTLLRLLLDFAELGGDVLEDFVLALELDGEGFDGVDFAVQLLVELLEFVLQVAAGGLEGLLQLVDFRLVLQLDVLEGLDEFLEDADEAFGLVVVGRGRCGPFLRLGAFGFLLQLFAQIVVFVDEHFEAVLDVLAVLVEVAVVQFLDGLGEFGVDLDQFLQTLFEQGVLLLQFLVALLQLLELALPGEVVLEPAHILLFLLCRARLSSFSIRRCSSTS